MKQMTSGMIAFFGVLAVAGCYSYSSEAINNDQYNTVQATPKFAVTKVNDSDVMVVRLVNDYNNGAVTSYTISNVGAGIVVSYQANWRPVYDSKLDTLVATGDKNAQQYYILGKLPGMWTFTITPTSVNTGVSTTVTALVSPDSLRGSSISKKTGLAAGDTVTITPQPNTVFSQTSVFTFQVGPAPALVGIAADSSSARILVAPGDSGKITVTKVGLPQSVATGVFTLTSTDAIDKVPGVSVAPTTVSTTTPALGTGFTATLGSNLRFLGSSHVFIGGVEAGVSGVSADSSTATITPMPGSTGLITYTNVALSFLTGIPLALNGDKSVTVGTVYGGPTDANANAVATASTITLTGSRSTVIADGGALATPCGIALFGATATCRYYKATFVAGAGSGAIKWAPATTADLGVYVLNAAGTAAVVGLADNNGPTSGVTGDASTSFNPSTGAALNLTAGAQVVAVVQFSPFTGVPAWYMFRISQP